MGQLGLEPRRENLPADFKSAASANSATGPPHCSAGRRRSVPIVENVPRLRIQTTIGHWPIGLLLIALVAGVVLARALPGLPGTNDVAIAMVEDETPPAAEPQPAPTSDPKSPAKPEAAPPSSSEPPADLVVLFPELREDELRSRLKAFSEAGHDVLSYRRAREVMYWMADNKDGVVTTIYARRPTELPPGTWPDPQVLNCEHLWPQSKGAKKPPMRTDLFHLRPAVPRINSTRSNHPFGTPKGDERSGGTWRVGKNEAGTTVFEPPASIRGDVSRSLFYFSVRYDMPINDKEESVLRTWASADPVDDVERARAAVIEEHQGNSNPFIIDETIVQRISDF